MVAHAGQGWEHVDLTDIQTTPWRIATIKALPDGRIFGGPAAYEDCFVFDPKSGQFTILGKAPLSMGHVECLGERIYLCGYPGVYVVEYDPTRPWTYATTTPAKKEPPITSTESNPRECYRFSVGVVPSHHVRGAAVGADGFLYVGTHAERSDVGGGIGWWDPVNRKPGGLRDPFLAQDCTSFTAAAGGRLMVYSSHPVTDPAGRRPTPKEARLFILDTGAKQIVADFSPVPDLRDCGPVAAIGNVVYGIGATRGKAHLFYAFDLDAKKTLFTRELPDAPRSNLAVGPDGNVYGFVGLALYRFPPGDADPVALGSVAKAGPIDFVGEDLYVASSANLLRVPAVTKLSAP